MEAYFGGIKLMMRYVLVINMIAVLCFCSMGIAQEKDELSDFDSSQSFQGFNLQGYSDSGAKSWDVTGDTADIMGSEIQVNNVNANSYGDQTVNVTADQGRIDQISGNMHLERDVIVTNEDGSQLMTDTLNWNRTNDLVSTPDDVMISDDRMTATGQGMRAQPGLKTATIQKDVTVRVKTEPAEAESQILTITSDGPMVIDQGRGVATFEDNVIAIETSRTLKADRMEVFFDQEMSAIRELICTGNVEILQGENKSYAERVTYNAKDQKIKLSGRPKLIMVTEGDGAITAFGN